jgi:hypothetical protein
MPLTAQRQAELLTRLEQAFHELSEACDTFLSIAESCRNPAADGIDILQNLKIARTLQDMAMEKYRQAVDAFSDAVSSDAEAWPQ